MPVLLDTDHLSILQRRTQPHCERLRHRLDRLPSDDIATTIVCHQEQFAGWQAYLNQSKTDDEIVHAYGELELMWRFFRKMNVVSFTSETQARFVSLRKLKIRIPTLDLRIASVALVTDSLLLSRNLKDFRQVPGLNVEDWSV